MAATLLNKGTTQPSSVQMQAFETLYPRSKYQTNLNPPSDFPAILKNFAREVLREQPENIYQFGIEYFTALKTGKKPKASTVIEKKVYHDHGQKQTPPATAAPTSANPPPVEEQPKAVEQPTETVQEPEESEEQASEEVVEEGTQADEEQIDSRPQSAYEEEEIPEDTQEGEAEIEEEQSSEEEQGESVYEEDSRPQSAMQSDE